jgi:hypothetical protein
MEDERPRAEDPDPAAEDSERGKPASEAPPDTSDHPSHEQKIGGKGAEDPAKLADEERYRKGPGW